MAGKIVILPETLTHRIAAGEVVERPASIAKELLENSLDAGATEIAVELEKGGCQSIRVTDNGEGMESADVPRAFARHATSKIAVFEDLYRVRSFGFRGEALPSIASIARVETSTRRHDSPVGTRIVIEGGEIREQTDAGCPAGTSILVSRIFDPVPVRRKFLKSDMTEQGYCLDWITRLALARPGIRIRVTAGSRTLLNVPAAKDPAERIGLTLGRDFLGQLLPVSGEREGVALSGFVSRPGFTRSSAAQIFIYVNGRFVKDYLLNHAVMTAFRRIIEPRRYPSAVLFLEAPSGDLDVNVHPTKMEVRFRNPREIYGLIVESLTASIGPEASPAVRSAAADAAPEGYAARVEEGLKRYRLSSGPEKLFFGRPAPPRTTTWTAPPPEVAPPDAPPRTAAPAAQGGDASAAAFGFSDLAYLGQVAGTYLVFSGPQGLVLVDQHAAHERILFEELKRRAAAGSQRSPGQRLLLPEVVSLPPRELSFLTESIPVLAEAGFEVEPFGGDSVVIKAIPAFLSDSEAATLIPDLIAECLEGEAGPTLTERREKIFTSLACRAAVKANRELGGREVERLCSDLDALAGAATCPHGRPLVVTVSKIELEKLFRRR